MFFTPAFKMCEKLKSQSLTGLYRRFDIKLKISLLQLDCFSQCSDHVSSSVAPVDWEEWARALAGECQEETGSKRDHR